ncbi:uncharacterized protein LOC127835645 [Dreissena polymorpha]|uniref:Uncharacterized protein n=1 Tax=Dreissena polymorpha TaxID=45954 RepID=A0A9D4G0C1_DREPO|nr:uncharacterized protein LOC127835645 [Dreissena polymorpha]KAH3808330.1 hypothetical protein DPMN_136683 [Dreissena polymorpha]
MASMTAKKLAIEYEKDVSKELFKYECLKDLDLFVLDNSIRESTVGQLRGHTIENKWEIFNEVTKCGFRHRIVASYNHQRRVDDEFVKEVLAKGEDPEGLWAFSEVTEGISKKVPDQTSIPVGLLKMKEAGLRNVIFEIDLGNSTYNFKKFTVKDMCRLVEKWVLWAKSNLGSNSKVLVSLRDLPDVMPKKFQRVFHVVDFLARLNLLFGICFEEPRGKSLPEECGTWAKFIRKVMDSANWKGHLLVHVHEKFGLMDATA